VIVNNLLICDHAAYIERHLLIPVSVPAGSRIAARYQASTTTNDDVYVAVTTMAQTLTPSSGLNRCITYGADTGDSGGTVVNSGGTTNTKGAWSQLAASTTETIRALWWMIGGREHNHADSDFLVDIGVGAAASEQVIIPDVPFVSINQNTYPHFPVPVDIPAGSRLAVRTQAYTTNATLRQLDFVLYGVS